jgi:two-component system, chemotaxis family, sensor kinase Cph1
MTPPLGREPDPHWGAGPYSIRRHGTTLTTCDSEPVHTPGCIQAHGALLVLRLADLCILQASENTEQHLGAAPARLLGQPVSQVVGVAGQARLGKLLGRPDPAPGATYAFTLPARADAPPLDACVHRSGNVAVLEFEATGRAGEHGGGGDCFVRVKSAVGRLQAAGSEQGFCQLVAQEVRALTGLDRVMVYRFHADLHGEVVAEARRDTLAPWLGLHYPQEDIPLPAREIFKRIWIRPLPDAAGPLVELQPLANPDDGSALDMTHCALRGASVMYTEYLANMGVAASLTMPILRDGDLWGLIACHHDTPTHFPYEVRAACELLAQVASLQLKSAEHAGQLAYRLKLEHVHQQLVARSAREGDLLALTAHQPSLLDAIDASGAALYHLDRWWCVGEVPELAQLDQLAAWLYGQPELESTTAPLYATDALAQRCPAAVGLEEVASGVLAVALSRQRRGLMLWFRPQTLQTVKWAGNPRDKPSVPGPQGPRLSPRASFALFVESVRGRSLPWSATEREAALRLRLLVLELVITRAERLADLNADLTRSNEELDAFAYVASHDLKEPLRGIHRYAHQLLESAEAIGAENHRRVENLVRLTVRMDSLLDSLLHFSRVGRMDLELEHTDLNGVLEEALEMIGARRLESRCTIGIPRPLPAVQCDPVRVREIYSNLLANALKYRRHAAAAIEVGYIGADESSARPNAPAGSAGQAVFYVRDDGIGIEPRHHEQVFRMFKRMHGCDEYGGGVGAGLTIVQKLVQRHGGRVWLDSKLGLGTTFYFTLPGPAKGA